MLDRVGVGSMDPLLREAVVACATVTAVCWCLSVITREHSWIDRVWSIAPVGYVGWFWVGKDVHDPRLAIMASLVLVWGGRLTYNFARKGGYARGGEDYRWIELKKRLSPRAFAVFNVSFVHGFQSALILLLTLPAWVVAAHPSRPLGRLDAIAIVLFLLFLVGEAVADEQQWRFQRDKKLRRAQGRPVRREFLTTGLFAWSRHPNFFCEQAMWWTLGLFAVAAGAGWLGVHWLGAVLLSLLFQGSTAFTERLTLAKYPDYAVYQRATPRLIPRRPGVVPHRTARGHPEHPEMP